MSYLHPSQVIEAIDYLRNEKNKTDLSSETLLGIYKTMLCEVSDIDVKKLRNKNVSEIRCMFRELNLNCKMYDLLKAILSGVPYNPPTRTFLNEIIENIINISTIEKFLPEYNIHKVFLESF